jgi:hypothetical protein
MAIFRSVRFCWSGRVFWQSIKTANGKFNYSLDLFSVESVKPLHEIVDVGASLKVFKNSRYRHPRALQDPRTTDFAGNTFDYGAL